MSRVQHWVALNAPGRGAPRWLGGGEIALSIRQVVDALNVHDIPTATDVIDRSVGLGLSSAPLGPSLQSNVACPRAARPNRQTPA